MNNQQENQHHIYFQTCLGASFSWRCSICNRRPRSRRCWAFSQWEAHRVSFPKSGGDKLGWMHVIWCWWLPPKIFVRCHSRPTLLLQEWSRSCSSSPPLHFIEVCILMKTHAWCPSHYKALQLVYSKTPCHCHSGPSQYLTQIHFDLAWQKSWRSPPSCFFPLKRKSKYI